MSTNAPTTAPLLVVIAEGAERRRRVARALEGEGFVVTAVASAADAQRVFAAVFVDGVAVLDGRVDTQSVFEATPTAVHLAIPRAPVCDDDQEVAQVIARVRTALARST